MINVNIAMCRFWSGNRKQLIVQKMTHNSKKNTIFYSGFNTHFNPKKSFFMQFLKKSSPTQDYSQPKKEHKNSSQQKNYLSIYANYYCFFLLK